MTPRQGHQNHVMVMIDQVYNGKLSDVFCFPTISNFGYFLLSALIVTTTEAAFLSGSFCLGFCWCYQLGLVSWLEQTAGDGVKYTLQLQL